MTAFLVGFAFGFIIGALLISIPWRDERRQRVELESMLGMSIRELIKRGRR
jgi:hypothetical protein